MKGIVEIYNTIEGEPGDEDKAASVDNRIRAEWNNYVSWLDKKGYKGKPELDKNGLGFKMIEQYKQENPETVLSKDMIIPIQKEFQNYRKYALEQIKAGKAKLADGVTEDNFMKDLSVVDGIPGQRTTSFMFPSSYLKLFDEKDKLLEMQNKGFAGAIEKIK